MIFSPVFLSHLWPFRAKHSFTIDHWFCVARCDPVIKIWLNRQSRNHGTNFIDTLSSLSIREKVEGGVFCLTE